MRTKREKYEYIEKMDITAKAKETKDKETKKKETKKKETKKKENNKNKTKGRKNIRSQHASQKFKKASFKLLGKKFPKDLTAYGSASEIYESVIENKKLTYIDPIGVGNNCANKEIKLSLAQITVKLISSSLAKNVTTNRGLLVWHSTGSGKTISSVAIMDSFWDTKKNIVFVSSIEALQSNPPSTYHFNAEKYFVRFQKKEPDVISDMFKKRKVKFMTFAQLSHFLLISKPLQSVKTNEDKLLHQNYLSNSVIIIDEVQNIFHPLPNQKSEHNALKRFLLSDENTTNKNMKVFVLTATPGDSVEETIDLLNIVRDRKRPLIKFPDIKNKKEVNDFNDSINGLVSYLNSSKDISRFPKIIADNHYKIEMEKHHFEKYVEVFNKNKYKHTDFKTLSEHDSIDKYYKTLRKYSNMNYNFDKNNPIEFFSNKIPKLLSILSATQKDKHYIYSAFFENKGYGGQGIRSIAKFIESQLGYVRIRYEKDLQKIGPNQKGYILAIKNELEMKGQLSKLIKIFNDSTSEVNCFLASQSFNEGVDLKNIKHIHIFEPMLTFNQERQAIGRAVRFCSHAALPYDEWKIKIHRYISTVPHDLTYYDTSDRKSQLQDDQLEESSITLTLNIFKGKKNVKSEVKSLKVKLKEVQKDIKILTKKIKEIEDLNIQGVFAIDELIYKESLDRIHEQNFIFNLMKTKAIDCQIMENFHRNGGEIIQCLK
jgi:superfamily II DNA or RNA helicase